jgi:hypothetical protein
MARGELDARWRPSVINRSNQWRDGTGIRAIIKIGGSCPVPVNHGTGSSHCGKVREGGDINLVKCRASGKPDVVGTRLQRQPLNAIT